LIDFPTHYSCMVSYKTDKFSTTFDCNTTAKWLYVDIIKPRSYQNYNLLACTQGQVTLIEQSYKQSWYFYQAVDNEDCMDI